MMITFIDKVAQKLTDFKDSFIDILPKTTEQKEFERQVKINDALNFAITSNNRLPDIENRPRMPAGFGKPFDDSNDPELILSKIFDDLANETPTISSGARARINKLSRD